MPGRGQEVRRERLECGEVATAGPDHRQRGAKPMGGKRPVRLAGQRAFILDRIATKPDITIRALKAELAEHGTIASYGAVWTFVHRQDLSHKKKPARSRAGSA